MLKHYLLTSFRTLGRNKTNTAINVFGLATGMTIFLLIAQYVHFEKSYENFIPGAQNIYRVSLETLRNNERIAASAENYAGLGPALKKAMPGVINFARLYNMGYINNVVVTNELAKPVPIALKPQHFMYADAAFLPMMHYQMIKGNASDALSEPLTAVISETYAKLYFGNEDPIGKTLHMHDDDSNDKLAMVKGVFKDLPANTHLKTDILFSYLSQYKPGYDWERAEQYTYIQLAPGTHPASVEASLPGLYAKFKPGNEKYTGHLQPLKDIHLKSDLAEELETNGSEKTVFFLTLIGLLILAIAWINYVNLSTARAIGRAKEVGVRKCIGAVRSQLIFQFLSEAAIVNLVALILAFFMLRAALPLFNMVTGLSLNVSYLSQPWFMGLLTVIFFGGAMLSGFYPAWILSYFKPVSVLKGNTHISGGRSGLRKALVLVQFVSSVALIAGTIIIYRQLHFMMGKDTGMNINQVLVLDRPAIAPNHDKNRDAFRSVIDLFREELRSAPGIEAVSNSSTIPGKLREYKTTVERSGAGKNESVIVRTNSMDFDFMNVFKMKLLAGRNFSASFPKDPDTAVIITESAAQLLGFTTPGDAIGKILHTPWNGWSPIIVGVVNDYHQVSFKKPLEPTMFTCDAYEGDYFSIRLRADQLSSTIPFIEQAWKKAFPGNPFGYFFLDEYFNRQYNNEKKVGQLFLIFSVLAIIISCLGLLGLSAYTASQRTREIGVRKVLGASVLNIATLLSKDFLMLVAVAIVIASPLAWLVMNNWLQSFAYREPAHWWIFALSGMVAVLIALITVSFQAIKAALANPVKSLRSE